MKRLVAKFLKDENGAQMAEYALLAVLIAILVAAVAWFLGSVIQGAFEAVVEGMDKPEGS